MIFYTCLRCPSPLHTTHQHHAMPEISRSSLRAQTVGTALPTLRPLLSLIIIIIIILLASTIITSTLWTVNRVKGAWNQPPYQLTSHKKKYIHCIFFLTWLKKFFWSGSLSIWFGLTRQEENQAKQSQQSWCTQDFFSNIPCDHASIHFIKKKTKTKKTCYMWCYADVLDFFGELRVYRVSM